jgi:hypothetical protein
MALLGFDVALEEKKNKAFMTKFGLLGVDLDLSQVAHGKLVVENTLKRKEELCAEIDGFITSGRMGPPEASSFRGRFGFAYAQCFGRTVAPQLRCVSDRAESSRAFFLDSVLLSSLHTLKFFLEQSPPRVVKLGKQELPAILYTDGACEASVTCGAVLFPFPSSAPLFWGSLVPDRFTSAWKALGVRHAVTQSELLPVLVSRLTWSQHLCGRDVILFIDNEGAREALVHGNIRSLANIDLLSQVTQAEVVLNSRTWYARVPSESNPADAPSRLDFAALRACRGSKQCQPIWPKLADRGEKYGGVSGVQPV